jgi:folate-binding protein YgfZ
MEAPGERREELKRWLERFILASDVKITDVTDRYLQMLLTGPRARALVESLGGMAPPPDAEDSFVSAAIDGQEVIIQSDHTTGEDGFLIWVAPESGVPVFRSAIGRGLKAGVVPAGSDALEVLRVEAGRPWFGADLDEQVLPVESGQTDRAVSFTKGCYCGQEVVARQHFLGKPRKRLCGLWLGDGEVRTNDPVLRGSDALGPITTAVRSPTLGRAIALAVLRGPEHPIGSVYGVVPPAGRPPVRAEVASLPFLRRT